jgi:hypothetical protein
MICETFLKLTPLEQSTFIGQLVHSVQNDETLLKKGKQIIIEAEKRGLFAGVIINPLNKNECTSITESRL